MTADNWEPSEEMLQVAKSAWPAFGPRIEPILIVVRPLIIAEERQRLTPDWIIADAIAHATPEIEAAERERIAQHFDHPGAYQDVARIIRALKGSKPSDVERQRADCLPPSRGY